MQTRVPWVMLLLASAACAKLNFLKPPAVPRRVGTSSTQTGPAMVRTNASGRRGSWNAEWPAYNNTLAGSRFSPLTQLTPRTVGALRRVCTFPLHERAAMQAGPVMVGGTLYVTTARSTYAIDAATCGLRWKHVYRYSPAPPFDLKVNRGVAYADGRVFRGANDGRVYALDARTGQEVWNVVAGDPHRGETFPAAPVVWHGLVFLGNAGGDNFGVRGRMMAFDARTGGRVWSFELVPESGEPARSWPPATEIVPKGGGASWTSYTVDTTTGTVYVPTGNAAPDFLPGLRSGDNLYTFGVVGLDARTGALRQWFPVLRGDNHDWDVAAAPALITTRAGKRLLAVAGKDGHVIGFDVKSGQRHFSTPVTTIANANAPLTPDGTRFCPGVNGGVEWNGPSYSPQLNALYLPAIDWCTTVRQAPPEHLRGRTGIPWTGSAGLTHPFGIPDSSRRGWLTAVDADLGTVLWRYSSPTPLVAGVTATAGGVVFTADLDGRVLAFDAKRGRICWEGQTGQPVGGGVVTYGVAGRQYVAVASGLHAPGTWRVKSSDATVIVFALP
ncbi:MAG: PQQ-binding-like beta-propeller repeat protein [Gemmatimonadales bacterium]|nr:PQQ-binding-like beta-propeller repeat protein [Gemmatimonadales bacterium]